MKDNMRKLFKNGYGETRSGWVVIVAILLITVALGIGESFADYNGLLAKLVGTGLYNLIIIGGGILLFKLIYKRSLCEVGLVRDRWLRWIFYGFLIGTISIVLIFGILLLCGQVHVLGTDVHRLLSISFLIEFISLCITVFSEEFIARGIIMTALKTTRKQWVVYWTSAVIFSSFHLMNPGVTILSYVNTLFAGLLFSYMFIKSGALWLPTGFHIAWNFIQGDIFGMNVSGNEQTAVFITNMGDNSILTGGSYGIEGGVLVTAVLLLGFLFVRLFVKTPDNPIWTIDSNLPLTKENRGTIL